MRQILMTVLLIAAVVSLYGSVVQEEDGMKDQIHHSGNQMAERISRISP